MTAFREATRGLNQSSRSLKALAHAEGRLEGLARRTLSNWEEESGNDAAEQDQ